MTEKKMAEAELDRQLEQERKEARWRDKGEPDKIRRKTTIARHIVEVIKERETDLGSGGASWSGMLSDQRYDGRSRTGRYARMKNPDGPVGDVVLTCSCGKYTVPSDDLLRDGFRCRCGKLRIPSREQRAERPGGFNGPA